MLLILSGGSGFRSDSLFLETSGAACSDDAGEDFITDGNRSIDDRFVDLGCELEDLFFRDLALGLYADSSEGSVFVSDADRSRQGTHRMRDFGDRIFFTTRTAVPGNDRRLGKLDAQAASTRAYNAGHVFRLRPFHPHFRSAA